MTQYLNMCPKQSKKCYFYFLSIQLRANDTLQLELFPSTVQLEPFPETLSLSTQNAWTSAQSIAQSVIFIFSLSNDSQELNSGPCWLVGSMFNWALSLWYETSPKHIIPIVQKTTFFSVNNRPNDILIFVSISVFILFVRVLFFYSPYYVREKRL